MSNIDAARNRPTRAPEGDLATRAAAIGATSSAGSSPAQSEPAKSSRAENVAGQRRRRQGMGAERNLKLHIPEDAKDPNFVYRWVNDRPGRVRQLTKMDDYEVVSSSELNGGDPDPAGNTAEGTVMTRIADKGLGEATVLLKKPKKYYEDDKREEAKVLDARDEMLRRGPPQTDQGLSKADNAYVPGGRNVVGGK